MKKIIIITFFLLILFNLSRVIAEEGSDGEVMEPETNSENTQPSSQPNNNNAKPLEEFVPSEEISVDRPVTFPVDI